LTPAKWQGLIPCGEVDLRPASMAGDMTRAGGSHADALRRGPPDPGEPHRFHLQSPTIVNAWQGCLAKSRRPAAGQVLKLW